MKIPLMLTNLEVDGLNFLLSSVEHEKGFITWRAGARTLACVNLNIMTLL